MQKHCSNTPSVRKDNELNSFGGVYDCIIFVRHKITNANEDIHKFVPVQISTGARACIAQGAVGFEEL